MSSVDTSNASAWFQTLSSLSGALSSHLQDKMLRTMDTDGGGSVEQSEFQAALKKVAGKLGIDVGEGASALYASLDADQDGKLNGGEVGSLLQSLFASTSNTQAFVQSRGDEVRFAELDTDSDGQISMAEFGITPGSGTTVVSTTTVITTTTGAVTDQAMAFAAAGDAAVAPGTEGQVVASADGNGNGEISREEPNSFVAQLNAQAEAEATKRYNDTALAPLNTHSGHLNTSA